MTDLDEIVEAFRLNIDRMATERLTEVLGMVATELNNRIPPSENVSRARLNEILDKIENEFTGENIGIHAILDRVREEIEKIV